MAPSFRKEAESHSFFASKSPLASITETKGLDSLLGYLIPQGKSYFLGFLIAACAAARRAIGTRKGEQLT